MSYDVRNWQTPADEAAPESFEAAARICSRLENLEPGPNPRFAASVEKMMELEHDGDSPGLGDPVSEATPSVFGPCIPTRPTRQGNASSATN